MLKKLLLPVLVLLSALGSLTLPGCKPRDEELQTSGALEFSADTVKFDTVFTTLRTVTKRLWVYNRNPKGVNVDLVALDQPAASPYTLIINGDLKQTASNLFIRGEDSLLILVRAKLPDNGQNGAAKGYVLEEKLNFRTNGQDQRVLLRSFGQNIYLYDNVQFTRNVVWDKDRPHVLYNTVLVPAGITLTIKPGTRIYAHAGARLLVDGTLVVNSPADYNPGTGATDTVKAGNTNIVRFAGDRSGEAQYATAPGQWQGIWLRSTSRNNLIRYAVIQNAAFGVLLLNQLDAQPRPDVTIQNSVVRYVSGASTTFAGVASSLGLPGAAVLSLGGKATVENTLFSDCYELAVLGYGGDYAFNYCTIANYAATGAVRSTPSLYFTNVSSADTAKRSALTVKLYNSVVWGAIDDELVLANYKEYQNGPVDIRNTLLRTKLYSATTDVATKPGLAKASLNNVVNTDPKFVRIYATTRNDYHLGPNSPGLSRGAQQILPFLDRDLLNVQRPSARPDLGAYQTTK
ncbi:MAG TPA: hypothetical protein VFO93_13165 [Hymenobacter sp.]|uniref:hypothetical protein n=1 Tax=Hymenobacter sp. TaxID=1898978 RepID=UPI002D7F18A1|nr:hypothetical protein [Hymenobacter sp.]HET9504484.1 hypothetical protein [Hymenobacter sp.]